MLNRTKIGQALVGAAFLMTAACHGGPNTLPATPLKSGGDPGARRRPGCKSHDQALAQVDCLYGGRRCEREKDHRHRKGL